MIDNGARYLIDTNTLITPYKIYYSFDLAPNFWVKLKREINNGKLLILDLVKGEVAKGDDELSDWIKDIDNKLIISRKSPEIMKKYSEILVYIQTCGYYKVDAVTNWSRQEIADAWIIAAASVHNLTFITQEKPNYTVYLRFYIFISIKKLRIQQGYGAIIMINSIFYKS